MNNRLLNEKGLTLVEILAVVAISSIIMALATSLIVQSMKNQERITAEAQLRDEADIIMSMLMKDFFSLKETEIEKVECGTITEGSAAIPVSCIPESDELSSEEKAKAEAAKQAMITCSQMVNCTQYAFVYLKDTKKIGFQGNTVFTRNAEYKMTNKKLMLGPYYVVELNKESEKGATSVIVAFQLKNEERGLIQFFQNEVVTVDDK